jgi:hypothetical protein
VAPEVECMPSKHEALKFKSHYHKKISNNNNNNHNHNNEKVVGDKVRGKGDKESTN